MRIEGCRACLLHSVLVTTPRQHHPHLLHPPPSPPLLLLVFLSGLIKLWLCLKTHTIRIPTSGVSFRPTFSCSCCSRVFLLLPCLLVANRHFCKWCRAWLIKNNKEGVVSWTVSASAFCFTFSSLLAADCVMSRGEKPGCLVVCSGHQNGKAINRIGVVCTRQTVKILYLVHISMFFRRECSVIYPHLHSDFFSLQCVSSNPWSEFLSFKVSFLWSYLMYRAFL